ncbi:hypothetical protein ACXR0O_23350 [Verrucomicrobiota bacterium sgz303538]
MSIDNETVLLISGASDAWARFQIESVGNSLTELVAREGGAAWAGWTENGLKVRIQRFSTETLRELLDAYLATVQKRQGASCVVEQQVPASPLPDNAAGEIPEGTVFRQKLTKKFLDALPEGACVVSNLCGGDEEIFAERVGPPESRETIWKRAVLAGANNRLCRVVWTQGDFDGMDQNQRLKGR